MTTTVETGIPVGDITLTRGASLTLLMQFNSSVLEHYTLVDQSSGDPVYYRLSRVFVEGVEYFQIDTAADEIAAIDLSGSELIFSATWPDAQGATQELRKSTDDMGSGFSFVLTATGQVQLDLTPEETRELPEGRVAKFEIERRIASSERVIGAGYINAEGGLNDDAV